MTQSLQAFSRVIKGMGSRCTFKLYAQNADIADQHFDAACDRLLALEQKYTRYRPDSITSRINCAAGTGESVALDDETTGLLHYADALFQQSDGLFDISSGILRQVWDFHSGKLPTDAELKPLLPLIGWSEVDWQPPMFSLPQTGMEIDFGGFVKEYAADQLAQLWRQRGVAHGFVNLGGDIVVVGPHPDESPWLVGIQHPRDSGKAIAQIPLTHGAIATSGDYERFMIVDGIRYSHLLNPKSGQSIRSHFASVSIVADQCLIAGSFSSLAMLKSESESHWLKESGVAHLTVNQEMVLGGNIQQLPG